MSVEFQPSPQRPWHVVSASTEPERSPQSHNARSPQHFYYFAYGSCMCPVDLKRSLGEKMHPYVIGPAILQGYRLGFFRRSRRRNCGVLDVVADSQSTVQGVLYRLPWSFSDRLDEREEGYRHETISVTCQGRTYPTVRTYTVIEKHDSEHAPNDWYFNIVLRGAITCGLPEQYCWQLFNHMHQLQQQELRLPKSA
ncbi:MAG: gamma-glutamylcyclotransferase [Elainellaceae cyanobacterium]